MALHTVRCARLPKGIISGSYPLFQLQKLHGVLSGAPSLQKYGYNLLHDSNAPGQSEDSSGRSNVLRFTGPRALREEVLEVPRAAALRRPGTWFGHRRDPARSGGSSRRVGGRSVRNFSRDQQAEA